jgi:hypothetical protein
MVAHRRCDVADLNQRARRRLRELGRIGPDQLVTERSSFAVGDRVVARRNDRRLSIANGHAGRIAAIGDRRIAVHLDDGRAVDLPEAYARAGHLDRGNALTAHLAQGAIVDRAFVLGSDELYREWGYTALSRHRAEARFYMSATPAFLNRAAESLSAEEDVTGAVTRMFTESLAEQLALHGLADDRDGTSLACELEQAHQRLAEIDARLNALTDQHARLRWHHRSRRKDLERLVDGWNRPREHWQQEVERLAGAIRERRAAVRTPLSHARDPLGRSETQLGREVRHHRDIGLER